MTLRHNLPSPPIPHFSTVNISRNPRPSLPDPAILGGRMLHLRRMRIAVRESRSRMACRGPIEQHSSRVTCLFRLHARLTRVAVLRCSIPDSTPLRTIYHLDPTAGRFRWICTCTPARTCCLSQLLPDCAVADGLLRALRWAGWLHACRGLVSWRCRDGGAALLRREIRLFSQTAELSEAAV